MWHQMLLNGGVLPDDSVAVLVSHVSAVHVALCPCGEVQHGFYNPGRSAQNHSIRLFFGLRFTNPLAASLHPASNQQRELTENYCESQRSLSDVCGTNIPAMSLHRPRVQYGKRRSKINIVLFLYSGEYE
jgi:hypothetical protein